MHCLCDGLCCEQLNRFPLGKRAEGFITLTAIPFLSSVCWDAISHQG